MPWLHLSNSAPSPARRANSIRTARTRERVLSDTLELVSEGPAGTFTVAQLGGSLAKPSAPTMRGASVARELLLEWTRQRHVQWNPHYGPIDSYDGPIDPYARLPSWAHSVAGEQLAQELQAHLDQLRWRGRTEDGFDVFYAPSLDALVAVSALEGALVGALRACKECLALYVVSGRGTSRRKSCSRCRASTHIKQEYPRVQEVFRRVCERIRKRRELSLIDDDQAKTLKENCRAVRARVMEGTTSQQDGIAQLNFFVAPMPRGMGSPRRTNRRRLKHS